MGRKLKPILTAAQSNPNRISARLAYVDALRGIAIVLMIVYHFCFDLHYFSWLNADFNHSPFWLSFRAVIVSSFLLLVGVSLVLAKTQSEAAFWRRVVTIAGCAALITLVSYAIFPASFIYFGILHHIALASILARSFVSHSRLALLIGVAVLLVGLFVQHPFFDQAGLRWVGLMTHKPITEDYVPLLPWFGVVLLGIPLGHWMVRHRSAVSGRVKTASGLVWLGRHSLAIYMLHQPLLISVLWLIRSVKS